MKKTLLIASFALVCNISGNLNAQSTGKKVKVTPVSDTPIKTQPEGVVFESIRRDGFSIFNTTFGTDTIHHTFSTGKFIKGKDGNVYVYMPIFKKATRSYLKLEHYRGDTLVAHTPQAIFYDDYEETTDYATRLELTQTGNGPEYIVTTDKDGKAKTDIFFIFKDNVLKQIDEGIDPISKLPHVVLGYTDEEGSWKWYAESQMVFQPMTAIQTHLSESIDKAKDLIKYNISYIGDKEISYSILVDGVIKDNEVFIHNPYHQREDHWIKGIINGKKAIFKSQYIGTDSYRLAHIFFQPATFSKKTDAKTGEEFSTYKMTNEIIFDYDETTQTFTAPVNTAFLINSGNEKPAYMAAYDLPKIAKYIDKAATPKSPMVLDALPYSEPVGGSVRFTIEYKDVNGEHILPQKLFYRIYLNHSNTPMVFKKEKYRALKEDITDMMSFATNYIDIEVNGNDRIVWIYESNYNSVGVQTVYKGGEEVRTSPIVWYDLVNTGISKIETNENVVRTEFFTLKGEKISNPEHGVFVKKTLLKDGTTQVQTIIKK